MYWLVNMQINETPYAQEKVERLKGLTSDMQVKNSWEEELTSELGSAKNESN